MRLYKGQTFHAGFYNSIQGKENSGQFQPPSEPASMPMPYCFLFPTGGENTKQLWLDYCSL